MSREFRLTPERRQRIIDAIRAGNYAKVACRFAGVGETTYYEYLSIARNAVTRCSEAEPPVDVTEVDELDVLVAAETITANEMACIQLVREIEAAEHEAEIRLVTQWSLAAAHDWRAAMQLLARRSPERWKERTEIHNEVTGLDGSAIVMETRSDLARTIAADPEARAMAEALLAKVVPAFVPGMAGYDEEGDVLTEIMQRDNAESTWDGGPVELDDLEVTETDDGQPPPPDAAS